MRRRTAAVLLAALVLLTAACSGSDSGDGNIAGVDGLDVTGKFGTEPKVTVDKVDVSSVESDVAIKGDGDAFSGDKAAHYRFLIAKASDGSTVASNYSDPKPETMVLSQQPTPVRDALDGVPFGSRVVITMPVSKLFGEQGAPQAGLAADDDIVMVFDLVDETAAPLTEPKGKTVQPPADAPKIVEKGGSITGLDFSDAPKADPDTFEVIPLVEGTGPTVEQGDQITANYLGTKWGSKEPFDNTFTGSGPTPFTIQAPGLIKGWVKGLVGQKVGSRVMLVVPADLGYGKQGNPQIKIGPHDTMVFVVDVLGIG